jgi:hypothetical protein
MGVLDRLLGRSRKHPDVGDAAAAALDPLDPEHGSAGDQPEGVPGKPVGEGGDIGAQVKLRPDDGPA